jgi:predicted transcriptional regulator
MATTPFSIRLDPKIKKRLQKEAKSEKRSAGFVVQRALEDYLDGRDHERKIADEAFAEAEKGVFISGEKVLAWMESWGTDKKMPFPEPDIFPDTQLGLRKVS